MKRRFNISAAETDRIAQAFPESLQAALQMGLIAALEATAKIQCEHPQAGKRGHPWATIWQEAHDGFYRYSGSIDTCYVAEYLDMVAQAWLKLNAMRRRAA
jgi:hypothetical protein